MSSKTYRFNNNDLRFEKAEYGEPRNLAIIALCNEGPYAWFTVNLFHECPQDCSFIDTNNIPDALDFLIENNIATPTGKTQQRGFCTYPEVKFNRDFLDTCDEYRM